MTAGSGALAQRQARQTQTQHRQAREHAEGYLCGRGRTIRLLLLIDLVDAFVPPSARQRAWRRRLELELVQALRERPGQQQTAGEEDGES